MSDKERGVETWTDERGGKMEIQSFFSVVYVDEELAALNSKYRSWNCDGSRRLSTMGRAEAESLAARILVLTRAVSNNPPGFVGVKKSELIPVVSRSGIGEEWFVDEFIKNGYLREKWVKGVLVLFPTEKLLENQRVPKLPALQAAR